MTATAHFPPIPLAVALPVAIGRILVIAASLAVWFWTQRLLARRNAPAGGGHRLDGFDGFDKLAAGRLTAGGFDGLDAGGSDALTSGGSSTLTATKPTSATTAGPGAICDRLHLRTTRINQRLNADPRLSRMVLISSSLVIDLLGLYMLGSAIFGRTFEPFLGLFMVFALRQVIQAFCPLPPPDGMIWRDTGFPTLLVTYGTSNDLFFSGHTAIAVYGAATLASAWGPPGIAVGLAIVCFEIAAVLLLRAHYTMDVFAGAVTALYIHRLAIDFAPTVDRWIGYAGKLGHF